MSELGLLERQGLSELGLLEPQGLVPGEREVPRYARAAKRSVASTSASMMPASLDA